MRMALETGGFSYQWQAGGNDISGADEATFELTQAQVGATITVKVSYTDGGNTVESLTSAATSAVANTNDDPTGLPTITGTPTQGATLTVNTDAISDADGLGTGGFSYQWQAGGNDISGATGTTFELTQAQVGATITVKVSYTDGGNTAESLTSAATSAVANTNDDPTGLPTITGTPTQGATLTVNTDAISDADGLGTGGFSYQWQAGGNDISGATESTFVLTQTQVGKPITVTVSYTDGGNTVESLTSAATSAITNTNDDPTGLPTISGTATQGATLTANTDAISDADGLGAFSYQWQADGTDISGATESTFVLTQTQVGKPITVTVSYTDGGNTVESLTSAATSAVANTNDDPTGLPTITGTPTQGAILTANTDAISDADGLGDFSYQWQADATDISGATGETFELTQAQVGATITVMVSYTDGGNTAESLTSAATSAVTNTNDAPTGTVTIDGTATQGATLTVNTDSIADADGLGTGGFSYQWQAGGNDINGADEATFALTQAQVGATITVTVSYTDGGNTAESLTSAATNAVTNTNDDPIGLPTISGTATQGETLTANTDAISDADGLGAFSYQWQAGGTDINGATGTTFELTQAQVGATITVTVSYTDGGSTTETLTSAATNAVTNTNDDPTGLPTITGTPTQGAILTVNTDSIADADGLGDFSYQWQADATDISGATGETFELTQAQVGATITVMVSYTDGGNTAESLTSAATSAVTNTNDAPTGTVTIDGTATQGATLTVNTDSIADADGFGNAGFSYQWQADGTDISDATGTTFELTQAQVGATITVTVSYTDGGDTDESLTSAATNAVTNTNDAPTGLPTITGTPTQGAILTVNTDSIADADGLGDFSYQWQADATDISGATGETFELTQAQVGATITVKVSYTDGGNTAETLTSAATNAVTNTNDAPTGLPTIDGTATQGEILTVNTDSIADADGLGVFSYQWQANGTDINGADEATFELTQDQVGVTITVKVSYTDGGTTAETLTSAATNAVTNTNDAPTGLPTISGTATQGATLTVNTDGIADADGLGVFSYQWQANGTAISGADEATFELTQAQVGATITVTVSYTDGGNTAETLTSAATATVTDEIAPVFSSGTTASVAENADVNTIVYDAQASDAGGAADDGITYTLSGTDANAFNINAASGEVTLKAAADFKTKPNYALAITATDAAGNAVSQEVTVTVTDTTPPTITINDITADNVINSNEVATTITGTVEADSTVKLTIGINVRTADVSGTNWSYTLTSDDISAMGEGDETISATATDTAGNEGTANRDITVDTVVSMLTIDDITADNIINANEVSTSITGSVEAGSGVKLSLGGNTRTATVATDGTWSYILTSADIAAMEQGAETITVTATDAVDNVRTITQDLTVDTIAPAISIDEDIAGDDIIDSSELTTTLITGTVETGSSVELILGGNVRTITVEADGTWSYTLTLTDIDNIGQGVKTITATATDAAGNKGTASRDITVSTQYSTIVRVIDDVSTHGSFTGDLVTGASTDDSTPMLEGTLNFSFSSGEILAIYDDDGDGVKKIGEATVTGTDWTYTPSSALAAGRHSFTARVENSLGAQGATTTPYVVNINPSISMTVTNDMGAVLEAITTVDNTLTLSGVLITALGTGEELAIYDGMAKLGVASVNADDNAWTFTTSVLSDGTYKLKAVIQTIGETAIANARVISATNTIGIVTTTPTQTAIIARVTDDVSTHGSIVGVLATGVTTDDTTPELAGTLSAALVFGQVLAIYDGARKLGNADVAADISWTYTPSALPAGRYSFTARVENSIGGQGAATAPYVVNINPSISMTVRDDAGTVTGIFPDSSNIITDDVTPTLSGTLATALGSSEELAIYNGTAKLGVVSVNADDNAWTFTTSVLSDGEHRFKAVIQGIGETAIANARVVSATSIIRVATTPTQTATIATVNDDVSTHGSVTGVLATGATTDDTTPTLSGTLSAALIFGQVLAIYDGATKLGDATLVAGIGATTWSYTPSALAAGGHSFTARVENALGAQGAVSSARVVNINPSISMTIVDDAGAVLEAVNSGMRYILLKQKGVVDRRLWVAEVEVFSNGDNIALNKAVTAGTANTVSGFGSPSAVTDGSRNTISNVYAANLATTDNWLLIDLGAYYSIDRVDVYGYNNANLLLLEIQNVDIFASREDFSRQTYAALRANSNVIHLGGTTGSPEEKTSLTPPVITTDDNTLTLKGVLNTALGAGEELAIYYGMAKLGAVTVNIDKSWTFTTVALSNGKAMLKAVIQTRGETDIANARVVSATSTIEIVTTTLTQTATITTVNDDVSTHGSVVGVLATGATTDDTTPMLSGTLSAALGIGEVLAIYDGTTKLGDATVVAGTWSYTPSALAAGRHSFTARVENAIGSQGAASTPYVVNINPGISITITDDVGTVTGALNLTVRYILLKQTGASSQRLGVAEVEAFSNGVNVALGKPVTVGVDDNSNRSKVTDGNLEVFGGYGTTLETIDNWVLIDLGANYAIDRVDVYVESNFFLSNIKNVDVFVSKDDFSAQTYDELRANSNAIHLGGTTESPVVKTTLTPPVITTDDNMPTLSGTLNTALGAGEELAIYDGTAKLGVASVSTVNTNVTWTFTPTSANVLADGEHRFKAVIQAVDEIAIANARVVSATSIIRVAIVPTQTAIIATVTDDVSTHGSVVGILAAGGTTDDTTPELAGTLSAALTSEQVLAIYNGATKLGDAMVTVTDWTYTPSALPAGRYSFTARVENSLGAQGAVSSARVVNINPSISMTVTMVDNTPTLSGALIIALDTGEELAIYDGMAKLGVASVNADDNAWTFTTSVLTDGTYRLKAVIQAIGANDIANGRVISATNTIGIVTTAPTQTATITRVTDDVSTHGSVVGVLATGATTDDTTPELAGTLSAALIYGQQVLAIYDGATKLGEATVIGTDWTYTPSALPAGRHSFTARVENSVGILQGAASTPYVVNINLGISMTVTDNAGAIKGVLSDSDTNIIDDATPTFSGTLATALGMGEELAIYDGAAKLGVASVNTVNGNIEWTFTPVNPLERTVGFHRFKAVIQAADETAIANARVISATSTIRIVALPTQRAIIAEVIDHVSTRGSVVGVLADGTTTDDTAPELAGLTVELGDNQVLAIYDGATKLGNADVAAGVFISTWTYTPGSALAAGRHSFTARVENAIGAQGAASTPYVVNIIPDISMTVTDDVGAITGILSDSGTNIIDDDTPTLSGTLAAALGMGEELAIYNGSIKLGVASVNVDDNVWTFTTSVLSGGTYRFRAVIQTIGENTFFTARVISATSTIEIVPTTPTQTATIARVTDDVSTHGSVVGVLATGVTTDDTTPELAGTLSAALISGQVLAIYDGARKLGDADVAADISWSYAPSALPAGRYSFTARVESLISGLQGAASTPYVVNINPGISMTVTNDASAIKGVLSDSGTNITITDDSTPTLSGTLATALGSSEELAIYNGTAKLGVVSVNADDNAWTFTTSVLSDGRYRLKAVIQGIGETVIANARVVSATSTIGIVTIVPTQTTNILGVKDDASTHGSVTGVLATGATTDDTTPTLSGTLSAALIFGQVLAIYDGATKLGDATLVVGTGATTWSYTPSALAAGGHSFTARVENALGAQGAVSSARVVNINPSISMTIVDDAGAVLEAVNSGMRYILLKQKGVVDRRLWVAEVEVFSNGDNIALNKAVTAGTANTVSGFGSPSAVTDGSRNTISNVYAANLPTTDNWLLIDLGAYYSIDRVDVYGYNNANSLLLEIQNVDIFASREDFSRQTYAALKANSNVIHLGGTTGSPEEKTSLTPPVITTDDNTLTLKGALNTALGAGEELAIYYGMAKLGAVTVNIDKSWTFTTVALSNGKAMLKAVIQTRGETDIANARVVSATSTIEIVTTTLTQTATITTVNDDVSTHGSVVGVLATGATTDDTTPMLSGTLSAALGIGEVLAIYDGTTKLGDATVVAGTWSYTPSALAAGRHSFTARVENAIGSQGAASTPYVVNINPGISITITDDVGTVTGALNPTVRYILLKQTGVSRQKLVVAEVEAFSNGVNVALGKPVTVGVDDNSNRSKVTDGNLEVFGGYGTTLKTRDNWVLIDLGANYAIDRVDVYVRNNFFLSNIKNVDIFVSKDDFSAQTYDELIANSNAIHLGGTTESPVVKTTLTPPVITLIDDNMPTLSGTLNTALGAGEELAIYDGTAKLGVASVNTVNTNVTWTFTPTSANVLADGEHRFKAVIQAVDEIAIANARVVSATSIIRVAIVPTQTATIATVTDDVSTHGSVVGILAIGATTDDTTPELAGTLSAALTSEQVLAIYNGATKLGDAMVTVTDWTYTPSALPAGRYSFTARVENAIGTQGAVSSARVVNINPSISMTVTNDMGAVLEAITTTVDNTPTLSGALIIALGTGEELAIYDGMAKLGVASVNADDNAWTFTTSVLTDGTYRLKAVIQAIGANGIANGRVISATNTIGIVTTAPTQTATITRVTDDVSTHGSVVGVLATGDTTDDTTPELAGTLSAALISGQVLAIYDGATKLGEATVIGTDWTYTPSALPVGRHSFTARVENSVGIIQGAASTPYVVNINPGISMTVTDDEGVLSDSDTNIINDATPTFSGTLATALGMGEELAIYDGAAKLGVASVNTVNSNIEWTFTPVNPLERTVGFHRFKAVIQAADETAIANARVISATSTIRILALPTLTQRAIIAEVIDHVGTHGSVVGVLAAGTTTDDTAPELAGLTVELDDNQVLAIYDGATKLGNADVAAGTAISTWTYTPGSALAAGRHSFTARVENSLGAHGVATSSYVVNIIPSISMTVRDDVGAITGILSDSSNIMTDDATPILSGTLAAALGTGEELAIYDGSIKLGVASVNADDNVWRLTTPVLSDGTHELRAVIQMIGENTFFTARVISATSTITIDSGFSGQASPAGSQGASAPQEAMYSSYASSIEARVTMQVHDDVGALTGKISEGTDTDDSTVSLTGTVTTFDTDGAVQVYDGETLLGDATIGSTVNGVTSWSYTPTALAIGSHTIAAFFVDGVGTPSTNSASTTFTVTATDTTFSAIATTDPISGLSVKTYSLPSTAMGQTLDFSGDHPEINVVNIAGSGANTVKIQLDDVLQSGINLFNDANGWVGLDGAGKHQLVVNGDADDTAALDTKAETENWHLAGTTTNSDHTYLVYNLDLNNADGVSQVLQVLVDQDMIRDGAIL